MAQTPRNRFSIDGFTPIGQSGNSGQAGRRVGFEGNTGRQPVLRGQAAHRVRMRRPGLHSAPAQASRTELPQPEPTILGSDLGTVRTRRAPDFTAFEGNENSFNNQTTGRKRSSKLGGRQVHKGRGGRNESAKSSKKAGFFGRMRQWRWKKIIKRTSIAVAVLALICGGWVGWHVFHASSKVFDGNLIGFLQSSKLKGEDQGRVNILLAGVSTDDPGHQGAELTDSIMLLSIDTKNHKAFMLSIPRDLWVDIPDYGYSKINAANFYGEESNFNEDGYAGGGMGMLEKVINDNFEVKPEYYAKINYSAFRDMVNAVGGISVNVDSDDPRGFYDPNIAKVDGGPLKLPNGAQTLDGQTALNFARARGDPTMDGRVAYGYAKSDFTRTQNQRTMMLALKDKITSGGVITNPIKIGELFDAVGKNVETNFKPSEIRRLYDLGKLIKSSDIQSLSLNDANGVNLLKNYTTADGASALIPAAGVDEFSQIQLFIKKQTSSDQVVKESAKVVVLNGGDITGLASKYSNVLTSKGLNVVAVGDAASQTETTIIDQTSSSKPATKARLQQIFGKTASTSTNSDAGYPTADFIIILGANQKAPNSSSAD